MISRYLFHCAEFLAAVTPFLHYQSSQASSASHFVIFAPHIDHPRPMPRPMPRSGIKKNNFRYFRCCQVLSGAVWCCRFWKPLCKHRFEGMIKLERRLSVAFSRSKGSWICSCHSFHTFMYFLTFCLSFPPLSFESHFLAFGFATLQPSCAFISFMKPQFLAGSRDPEISLGIIRYFLICVGFGTHLQSLLLCSC